MLFQQNNAFAQQTPIITQSNAVLICIQKHAF